MLRGDNRGHPGEGGDPARRAAGALEAEVLDVLWRAKGAGLTPGEVQQRLGEAGSSLAYSTVVTILSRLHAKGVLDRRRDGRSYRYTPLADQAGLTARAMRRMLDDHADRDSVLSSFVSDLSDRDEQLLLRLLSGADGPIGDHGAPQRGAPGRRRGNPKG